MIVDEDDNRWSVELSMDGSFMNWTRRGLVSLSIQCPPQIISKKPAPFHDSLKNDEHHEAMGSHRV